MSGVSTNEAGDKAQNRSWRTIFPFIKIQDSILQVTRATDTSETVFYLKWQLYGGCIAVGQDGLQGDHLESCEDGEEGTD